MAKRPSEHLEVPPVDACFSTRTTLRPNSAARNAAEQPVPPLPTTTTSTSRVSVMLYVCFDDPLSCALEELHPPRAPVPTIPNAPTAAAAMKLLLSMAPLTCKLIVTPFPIFTGRSASVWLADLLMYLNGGTESRTSCNNAVYGMTTEMGGSVQRFPSPVRPTHLVPIIDVRWAYLPAKTVSPSSSLTMIRGKRVSIYWLTQAFYRLDHHPQSTFHHSKERRCLYGGSARPIFPTM